MKILFVTRSLHPPQSVGGAEKSKHELFCELGRLGHRVLAIVGRDPHDARPLWRRFADSLELARSAVGRRSRYRILRLPGESIAAVLARELGRFKPDLVITQQDGCMEYARQTTAGGIATLVFFNDPVLFDKAVSTNGGSKELLANPLLGVVSNSRHMSDYIHESIGLRAPIVHPMIDLDAYRAEKRDPEYVTFINPRPHKGRDLAIAVARLLPRRRFLFVEGLPLEASENKEIRRLLAGCANVTWQASTNDMQSVYARTRLLIVPSQWQEPFGRVVLEAQVNGIPVLASSVGGLPEVVGDGGILLSAEATADEWAKAVDALLSHDQQYGVYAGKALANARHGRFRSVAIVHTFLEIAGGHIRQNAAPPG
jgi:glycosyltransferase involved in cell wall biosynthesis